MIKLIMLIQVISVCISYCVVIVILESVSDQWNQSINSLNTSRMRHFALVLTRVIVRILPYNTLTVLQVEKRFAIDSAWTFLFIQSNFNLQVFLAVFPYSVLLFTLEKVIFMILF